MGSRGVVPFDNFLAPMLLLWFCVNGWKMVWEVVRVRLCAVRDVVEFRFPLGVEVRWGL